MTRDQLATVTDIMGHVSITQIDDHPEAGDCVTLWCIDPVGNSFDAIDVWTDGEPTFWKGNKSQDVPAGLPIRLWQEWNDR